MVPTKIREFKLQALLEKAPSYCIYSAEHIHKGTIVILKIARDSNDGQQMEALKREARIHQRLTHPNIQNAIDLICEDQHCALVYEMVAGRNLAFLLRQGRPLQSNQILMVMIPCLDALNFAHSKGIIHRKMTPTSIFVSKKLEVKVSNFGTALDLADPIDFPPAPKFSFYASPEIMRPDGGNVDHRTDVYSMGSILYHMATGVPPFSERHGAYIKHEHHQVTPTDPKNINTDISPELTDTILKAMATHPNHRFSGCGHFASALRLALPEDVTSPSLKKRINDPSKKSLQSEFHFPEPGLDQFTAQEHIVSKTKSATNSNLAPNTKNTEQCTPNQNQSGSPKPPTFHDKQKLQNYRGIQFSISIGDNSFLGRLWHKGIPEPARWGLLVSARNLFYLTFTAALLVTYLVGLAVKKFPISPREVYNLFFLNRPNAPNLFMLICLFNTLFSSFWIVFSIAIKRNLSWKNTAKYLSLSPITSAAIAGFFFLFLLPSAVSIALPFLDYFISSTIFALAFWYPALLLSCVTSMLTWHFCKLEHVDMLMRKIVTLFPFNRRQP